MPIPFLDLRAQHEPLRDEILQGFAAVIEESAFAGGRFVTDFETDFSRFCGVQHAVGVGSGTEALWLTLLALGVRPGDEVITVAATFFATAEAISHCGAIPVFVDVDADTFTLDPELLERAITPKTKAIIPVHLYGQVADMDPILKIAQAHGIPVVEDACQAHGATYRGQQAGSLGIAGCFSFYPGKNLGAMGEAGAIVTNDAQLAEKLRVLRDHGQRGKYNHFTIGWNGRMDGLQAVVLQIKLRGLITANAARRSHAERYRDLLARSENIILPKISPNGVPNHHVFVVRVRERDAVLAYMSEQQIACGIHYPVPVHRQPAYLNTSKLLPALPVTDRWSKDVLSLPMFPELTQEQINTVARELIFATSRTEVRTATVEVS